MSEIQQLTTPVGELNWIFITGKGKKDPSGNDRFSASINFPTDSEHTKFLKETIEDFWQENKPTKAKAAKSLGWKDLEDEDGEPTGITSFNFWTGIEFPSGDPKTVKIFNAKGAEVSLGKKKIGNGSRGRIQGAMAIYENKSNIGVTLYLNGIQLTKFIPYEGGVSFDAVDDDETDEAFEGFDDELPPVEDDGNDAPPPRL